MRKQLEPLIFEISSPGRKAYTLPGLDVPQAELPAGYERSEPNLPEVSELDFVTLIDIDDSTVAALGWPISRALHANLARVASDHGARVLVYDVLFRMCDHQVIAGHIVLYPANPGVIVN